MALKQLQLTVKGRVQGVYFRASAQREARRLGLTGWVKNRADGSVTDWIESEIPVAEIRWLRVDTERLVTTGNWVEHPDLSRVDEVGFVDLMPGSGHGPGGWSDVGRVQVYGKPVKRS